MSRCVPLRRGCPMNSILTFLTSAMKPKGPHEFAGPCPQCGGEDRFIVWPDRPRGGAYLCRGCDQQGGDGIQFMRKYMGMSYAEACAALGLEPKRTTASSFPARRSHARPRPVHPAQIAPVPPAPAVLPCKEWMASAAAFVDSCQRDIETSPEALLAVCGRFLTPYTAVQCGIGWNPADRYILRESWGLPVVELAGGGKRDKLILPRGLVIATRREAGTVALTVRCADDRPESRPKYWQVKGSSNVPFIAGHAGLPVVLVESALDAALVWQESFGKLAAVAFMGCTKPVDADTDQVIKQAPILLACPDNDTGGLSAWQRWSAAYPRAILTPAVGAKDLGDMHRAALTWPINPDIPSVMEWAEVVLSAIPHNSAHTSPMSHENTQPDYCATSGMKEAA